jgi:CheY-like chemotaxis protein
MATSSKRVLILDDHPDSADSLGAVVEMCGHIPLVAYDAETALEMAHDSPPDIFILDLALPVLSGYYVAWHLRAQPQFRESLMVALSGYTDMSDVRRALNAGFDLHVAKPISAVDVARILDNSDELIIVAHTETR